MRRMNIKGIHRYLREGRGVGGSWLMVMTVIVVIIYINGYGWSPRQMATQSAVFLLLSSYHHHYQ